MTTERKERRRWKMSWCYGDGGWREWEIDGPELKSREEVQVTELLPGDVVLGKEEVEKIRSCLQKIVTGRTREDDEPGQYGIAGYVAQEIAQEALSLLDVSGTKETK